MADEKRAPLLGDSGAGPRHASEENFKAAFGRYPERADLPEPTPSEAGFVARLFHKWATGRDDYRPPLRVVEDDDA